MPLKTSCKLTTEQSCIQTSEFRLQNFLTFELVDGIKPTCTPTSNCEKLNNPTECQSLVKDQDLSLKYQFFTSSNKISKLNIEVITKVNSTQDHIVNFEVAFSVVSYLF